MPFTVSSSCGQWMWARMPPGAQTPSLACLLDALGSMFDPLQALIAEQGTDGEPGYLPGWGALLDPSTCPVADLPYLAQYVGVVVPTGADQATALALTRGEGGKDRGKITAIQSAIQSGISTPWQPNTAYVTGGPLLAYGSPAVYYEVASAFTSGATFSATNLTVVAPTDFYQLIERSSPAGTVDAYQLTVVVRPEQLTPSGNVSAITAAILAVKPAGVILNLVTNDAPLVSEYTRDFSAITATLALAQLSDVT